MNADLLKTCHREIGHIVFDGNEKITVRRISNTWNLDTQQSMVVLQQWIDENKEKKQLSMEYITRLVDKNGDVHITLANEQRTQNLCKVNPKCFKMLYSVEVASDVRPLNVVNDNEFSVINLRLVAQKRLIDQRPKITSAPNQPVAPVKQEAKASKPTNNLFSTTSKSVAKKNVEQVAEEKVTPPTTPKQVKVEPKEASAKKASPKKQSPKKDTKTTSVVGKGSISAFFSSKPAQPVATPKTGAGIPVKQEPPSPAVTSDSSEPSQKDTKPAAKVEQPAKQPEKSRKRTITDDEDDEDVIPNTPQEEKKRGEVKKRGAKPVLQRKKSSNPKKKSRILEICDSSSDEEMDTREAAEERKERLIELDEEMVEPPAKEARKSLSPEKPVENDSNSVNRNRGKVKKLITKTYADEDGYMITVKEYEMVSEDETTGSGAEKEVNPVKSTKPLGKTPSVEKKETPPTPKTKQGSIMSFFSKK
ncbi:DNA polymerase delta subunit 3 [Anopheles nili]|uniref:DNA polymerase delta subunit 3 n=1 Tax=Anopheles nili TaxID=185578 RepID=UPI00237AC3C6|nr:DNA polymerase delta subunit 3 [Anopheles nili]